MKKALVTGGAGFIGSHIVDELVKRGYQVVALDNESAESNDQFYWNENATKEVVDITDWDALNAVFEREKPDYVFHLAAESRIQPTLERPQRACEVNFLGTCNVLQAARTHKAKRVMYSSTSSAYGLDNTPPLKEDMHRDCLNPYSVTKVAAEDLCKMYYSLWGLETVIFRYFNIYGERQPIKGVYAPVVGIFQRQHGAGEPMTIVGDGLQRRDFTHVSDVVQANLLAAESERDDVLGEIFNVGTGKNHSVLDVSKMVGGEYKHIEARPGEAEITLANIAKIQEYLNYEPTVELEDWINGQKR
mgnify:CR=1 FL=1|jgi:UDP-glucose 4-epimerase|tara:strand:- start:2397 stop:3305 length:909 start_codon:yes stop_codon:yes gene_type:complete